jgi:cold shock CspA family protein
MTGLVLEFDDDKGIGTVRGDDGRELFFHCTQIADGTRTIDTGARVTFEVVPGHRGQYQAVAVAKS